MWKGNRYKEAIEQFSKARRLDPKNAYTLYFLGRVYDDEGETAEAVRCYGAELALGQPVYDTNQRRARQEKGAAAKP